jgi:hypothetical protein
MADNLTNALNTNLQNPVINLANSSQYLGGEPRDTISQNNQPSSVPLPDIKKIATPRQAFEEKAKLIPQKTQAEINYLQAKSDYDTELLQNKATANEKYYTDLKEKLDQTRKQEAEWGNPEFHPTQENVSSLGSLFSMLATAGLMLGHQGKLSGITGMNAMSGILKGWREGREDLYNREVKEYEKQIARIKQLKDDLRQDLKDYKELAVVNRDAALDKLNAITAKVGQSSILGAQIQKMNIEGAENVLDGLEKLLEHEEAMRAKKKEESQKTSQQQFIAQRVINAGNEIVESMDAVMLMSKNARSGILPYISNKEGFMNFLTSSGARKLSSNEASAIHTFYTGLKRNLATIEATGTAQGLVSLSSTIGDLEPLKGDNAEKVAAKFAETRKIVEATLLPMSQSGLLQPKQANEAVEIVNKIRQVIPYTIQDIAKSLNKTPETIGERSKEVAQPESTWSEEKERRYQELKGKQNAT